MNKRIVALASTILLAGALMAQSGTPSGQGSQAQGQVQQTIKVSGTLELIEGTIGLKAADKSYLVPNLRQLIGFVKNLQEGASVTVEGYEMKLPYSSDVSVLMVTKLSFGGKDYDLATRANGRMMMRKGMMGRGMMGMGEPFGGRW